MNSNLFFLLRFCWSWDKCLSVFSYFVKLYPSWCIHGHSCSTGLSMNLSTDLPHFLLNGKKHPVTSRYFLGLVSICQSGFLMFFPFPQCLYILPKQHTRFMLPSVTKDSMVIFVCLGSYIWYWHPKIILIKSFIRDDII